MFFPVVYTEDKEIAMEYAANTNAVVAQFGIADKAYMAKHPLVFQRKKTFVTNPWSLVSPVFGLL